MFSNLIEAVKVYPWVNFLVASGFLFLIVTEIRTLCNLHSHIFIRMMLGVIRKRTTIINNQIDLSLFRTLSSKKYEKAIIIQDFRSETNLKLSENLLDLKICHRIFREPNFLSPINEWNAALSAMFLLYLLFCPQYMIIPIIICSLSILMGYLFEIVLSPLIEMSHEDFLSIANAQSDTKTVYDCHNRLAFFSVADIIISIGVYVYGLFLVPGISTAVLAIFYK